MAKRSINQILDAPFSGDGDSHSDDYHAALVALREARAFLEDMVNHCHGKRAQRAVVLLEKWDKHDD